ncbi:MAG: acyl-CoA thioesterase-1 [Saprospiraceae bacterium]|jgi:acyl-CoA thioesterase-1
MILEKLKLEVGLRSFLFLAFVISLNCGAGLVSDPKIKVACIGDSITFGARLEYPEKDGYPAQLQKLMGDEYEVFNFGVGGCTLLRKGRPTVWDQLLKIKDSNPDLVVISLGTNDTCGMGTCQERKCWDYKDEFPTDYKNLIDTIRTFPTKPKIWICAPTPMVMETPGLSAERVEGLSIRKPRLQSLISHIRQLAKEKDTGFIDLNTPMNQRPALFTEEDGVHPNMKGYKLIAELVYEELSEGQTD